MLSFDKTRRGFLRAGAVGGGALLSAPYIGNAKAAETITWRVQTSSPTGINLKIFKDWCNSIKEKTGGELEFIPFGPKDIVGSFQLFDAVKNGVLEAMNSASLLWAKRVPLAAFLSSYPLGLRYPHEWDTFFYGLGGLEIARTAFAEFGLYYIGPVHQGPNIIHSKVPINSIEDFKGLKIRMPGGIIADVFKAAGAKTVFLPGREVLSALEKNTITAADFGGPALNYALGFHEVADYISVGPPGLMSIYQPVDLQDLTVRMDVWQALPPHLQKFIESEVLVYSALRHAAVQVADLAAWKKFEESGTIVTTLREKDVDQFTELAVPIWFKWANKNKYASQAFRIQLDYMLSKTLRYISPIMIKGHSIKN